MEEEHPLMILLAPLSDEVYNVQHLELRGINTLTIIPTGTLRLLL